MNALAEMLDRLVAPDRPDAPAVIAADGRVVFTRGSLAARVRACAGAFERAGIAAGDAVAFGIRQDADGIAWLLAALRAGVRLVILDPGLTPANLADRCRVAGVTATVLDGGVASIAHHAALRRIASWRGVRLPDPALLGGAQWTTSRGLGRVRRLDRLAGGDARRPLAGDAAALVIFTSGTTGAPRGVVHTPTSLAATLDQAAALVPLGGGDRVLGSGFHLVGPALLGGAAVVVPPAGGDVARLARVTREAGTTHVSLPLHRAVAWAAAGGAGPAFRHLLLGSAPVRNAGLRELRGSLPHARVTSAYGMTEHLLVAAVTLEDRLLHDEREGDLVGSPLPGVRLTIAPDGEVRVAGPALAWGYLGDEGPATWLSTGDLGRLDADGRVVLVGRRKEMLIRDGVNIYPGLYEATLAELAGIVEAVMVGVERPDGDELVALFAAPRIGEAAADARRRLAAVVEGDRSLLDDHARPDVILGIDAIPRSGRSAKPDRAALARIAAHELERTPRARDRAAR